MVSLPLMAQLLQALPDTTRLVLVGDPRQLASVEAGTVLADIVGEAVSDDRAGPITGFDGERGSSDRTGPLADAVIVLQRPFRFDERSALRPLAEAIRIGDETEVHRLLDTGAGLRFVEHDDPFTSTDGGGIRQPLVEGAATTFRHAGTGRANEALLSTKALVRQPDPVLITRNDPVKRLNNGDIGVVVADPDGERTVAVERADGLARLRPVQLADVETMRRDDDPQEPGLRVRTGGRAAAAGRLAAGDARAPLHRGDTGKAGTRRHRDACARRCAQPSGESGKRARRRPLERWGDRSAGEDRLKDRRAAVAGERPHRDADGERRLHRLHMRDHADLSTVVAEAVERRNRLVERVGVEQANPSSTKRRRACDTLPQPHWSRHRPGRAPARATPGTVRRRTTTSFAAWCRCGRLRLRDRVRRPSGHRTSSSPAAADIDLTSWRRDGRWRPRRPVRARRPAPSSRVGCAASSVRRTDRERWWRPRLLGWRRRVRFGGNPSRRSTPPLSRDAPTSPRDSSRGRGSALAPVPRPHRLIGVGRHLRQVVFRLVENGGEITHGGVPLGKQPLSPVEVVAIHGGGTRPPWRRRIRLPPSPPPSRPAAV